MQKYKINILVPDESKFNIIKTGPQSQNIYLCSNLFLFGRKNCKI